MSNEEFDIISIGDATIDNFVLFHDAEVNCEINEEKCQLCINYADKLPVDKYVSLVAGNAANNAVGSSRLGLKAAYYVVLGDDEGGRRIREQLQEEGVNCRYVTLNPETETNTSFVLSFKGERTILVYHVPHKYKLPEFAKSEWVYLTSTGPGFEPMFEEVVKYVKKTGVKLGYNPGTFQLRGDEALMSDVLKVSEVSFVNVEEAQHILGTKDRDLKVLLSGIHDMGSAISVITDGQDGAYCYDGDEYWYLPQFTNKKVETTGAGDSFAVGFVAALYYGRPIEEALRWASINANSVVQKIGPQAGLLTKNVLEQRLQTNPDYEAVILDGKPPAADENSKSVSAPQSA